MTKKEADKKAKTFVRKDNRSRHAFVELQVAARRFCDASQYLLAEAEAFDMLSDHIARVSVAQDALKATDIALQMMIDDAMKGKV